MKTSMRTLSALMLVGAISSAACGDDDNSNETPVPDSGATGVDSGTPTTGTDAGNTTTNPVDGGTPATGNDGGGSDAGNQTPVTPMLTACPAPTVDMGMVCQLSFSQTAPLKQSVTLSPVTGKLGYSLSGGVFVGEDVGGDAAPAAGKAQVTLTITAGTQIIGDGPLSFLLVNRGSKIVAEGTASSPVVFTSVNAATGTAGAPGQWGGLILNGRAPSNQGTSVNGEANTGVYGGSDPADNSGTLKYVRLEWTGGKINDTNELNGIAFQAVGSGTTVDFVHVHGSDDDAFEWFGGTVNAKHLIATATGDDSFDWTDGYTGKIQYAIAQQWPRVSSADPNGIEADNRDKTPLVTPVSSPTISNLTLVGNSTVTAGYGTRLRRGTQGKIHNAIIQGYGNACIFVDGAESQGFVGNQLALFNSRISCTNLYETKTAAATAPSQALVEGAAGMNMTVPVATALLTDAVSTTAPNFAPAAGSAAATGGAAPAGDTFFTAETFIGAVGTTNWTTGGWFKPTAF
jgi:trimeric autotransporter adhesin